MLLQIVIIMYRIINLKVFKNQHFVGQKNLGITFSYI